MKGTPKRPFDGYQEEAIELLTKNKVRFKTEDVMPDADMRDILKELTKWKSYPMVYIEGNFKGGLNFLREASLVAGMATTVPTSELELTPDAKVELLVSGCPMIIFIRGSIKYPSCTDSKKVVNIIKSLNFK